MKTQTRSLRLFVLAAILTVACSSCNTFRGFGRDVRHAGGHIERAAN